MRAFLIGHSSRLQIHDHFGYVEPMYRKQALLTPRILWAALLVSVAMYAAILGFDLMTKPKYPADQVFLYVFSPLALIVSITSFVLPARLHKQAIKSARVKVVEERVMDETFSAAYREAAPSKILRFFASKDEAERAAAAAFMSPFIISLALSEAVVLFGFLLGFLGFNIQSYIPFFVLGTILLVLRFPTEKAIFSSFERIRGASFKIES